MSLGQRISQSIRWRLGLPVAAAKLETGTDESVVDFYSNRVTDCEFLNDPEHYEHPRASWVLENLCDGTVLEIGAGNGGMTRLIAPRVQDLTAFDVSAPSLKVIEALGLPNVHTVPGLLETFVPTERFDCIVISEVIEHLRKPAEALDRATHWLVPGGRILITTPNGHWESDEHLHEFSMQSLAAILSTLPCESFDLAYLRDRENRHRWLTAIVRAPNTAANPNDFFDRAATARKRRHGI